MTLGFKHKLHNALIYVILLAFFILMVFSFQFRDKVMYLIRKITHDERHLRSLTM
uniref:Uncharacterized protein n=1 Tax=Aegilops tauschii subsp. strangulata TaxID=200361 RepID=A0A453B5W8_AEGTS